MSSENLESKRQSSIDELRELGQRARRRLEEEKAKRPEIVQLSQDPKPKIGVGGDGFVVTDKPQRRKRPRRRVHEGKQKTKCDRWLPIIYPIDPDAPTSSVVMLHGLPEPVTTADICRFFRGLTLRRILLLGKFEHAMTPLDATVPSNTPRIPRLSTNVRVWVEFDSTDSALMAAQQHGQPFQLKWEADDDDEDEQSTTICAIGVIPLPKDVADWGLRHLAVDVKASSLQDAYNALLTEARCLSILWSATLAHFRWFCHNTKDLFRLYAPPDATIEQLVEHRTALFRVQTEIRTNDCLALDVDPVWMKDPANFYPTRALGALQGAIRATEQRILFRRQLEQLSKS